jgi:type VI secretion system protein ImpA
MPLPDNLLEPIAADNPCGEPASAARWYDKIRELRKPNEAAIEAFLEKQTDRKPRIMTRDIWAPREPRKLIDTLCDTLATKSKDVEIAAWLTESLTWRDGFAGLAEGLALIQRLLETYWDTLHPLPEDPGDYYLRVRHLEWIGMSESTRDSCVTLSIGFIPVTQSGLTLNQYQESRTIPPREDSGEKAQQTRREAQAVGKVMPEDFETAFAATKKDFYKKLKADATASRDALAALEDFCSEKFASDPPGFTKLKERLEAAENTAEILLAAKLKKDPDPIEAPPPPPPPEPGEEPAPGAEAADAAQAAEPGREVVGIEPASKQEAFLRTAAIARYLRRTEPGNPVPYLLLRSLRWGELYGAGDNVTEGLLTAPPTQVRAQLKSLAAAEQWGQVLELAESSMAEEYGRGWLDLQRYSVKACEELGYTHAARAIKRGVRHLLSDYPALPTSTLNDDTGAANPETAKWLEETKG